MTLTNYWWLLIWLALVGGILAVIVPKQPVKILDKTEYRWGWLSALALAFPYVLWAMNRSHFGDIRNLWKNCIDFWCNLTIKMWRYNME